MFSEALSTCSSHTTAPRYLSPERVSIFAVELCQFNLIKTRSVCDSLFLPPCTSSLLPKITASPSLLPLSLLHTPHLLPVFVSLSLSSCYLFIPVTLVFLINLFLAFEVHLVCLSVCVCFAGELVCIRLAVGALLGCVIMPVWNWSSSSGSK